MDWLYLVGRVLFALIFVASGVGHFAQLADIADYAGGKRVPAAKVTVTFSGLILLAGGLSVMLGVWVEIGAWLLFFFLIVAGILMHDFWAVSEPLKKMVEQAQFMKNISMAGAALLIYWMVQTYGYGPFSLGSPL